MNFIESLPDAFNLLTLALLGGISVYFLQGKLKQVKSGGNLKKPPSLPWLPLVGSLPFIPDYAGIRTFFTKKAEELGPVIGFYMGRQYTVMITSTEAIQDALVKKHDMASRPTFFSKDEFFNPGYKGIVDHMYDEEFKSNRVMILNTLREFGFGKRILESRIRYEVDHVINVIREKSGKEFDPRDIIASGIFNITSSILFNKRYESEDEDFKKLLKLIEYYISEYYDLMPVDFFKQLLYLPSYRKILSSTIRHRTELVNWMSKAILDAISRPEQAENFVSYFIDKLGKDKYDYEHISITVRDLALGGIDTTTAFTRWFIVYMANNPNIQARVQEELDRVVGNDREITLEDEKNLPYTQATILELMRRQTIGPLGIPRRAVQDTSILGYFIPANTTIITNLYGAHMDPNQWTNPEEFNPGRFLDENGLVYGKERMIAFSMGKRACIGETLARQDIFLFASSLVHHFKILPPEGMDKIDAKELVSVVTSPSSYKARFLPRN